MKQFLHLRYWLPAFTLAAATSCTPQLAYQVLETHASATPTANNDLRLDYNFWHEDGGVSCTVTNLTNAPLYVDLGRTQLIVNGLAQDYYQDEELTTTTAVARTRPAMYGYYGGGTVSQSARTRSHRPRPILQVPPHAAIVIDGLSAVPTRVVHCELDKWRMTKPATVSFTEADSPLKFRQFLTYSTRPDGAEARTMDHAFWVERVSNMSPGSFRGPAVKEERCGKKLMTTHPAMPYAKSGNLYVVFRPISTL